MTLFDVSVRCSFLSLSCFAALQGIYMHSLSRHQQRQMQPHSSPILQQQQQQQPPKGGGVSAGAYTRPLLSSTRALGMEKGVRLRVV